MLTEKKNHMIHDLDTDKHSTPIQKIYISTPGIPLGVVIVELIMALIIGTGLGFTICIALVLFVGMKP